MDEEVFAFKGGKGINKGYTNQLYRLRRKKVSRRLRTKETQIHAENNSDSNRKIHEICVKYNLRYLRAFLNQRNLRETSSKSA